MADKAHRLTDEKLEEIEKRLSDNHKFFMKKIIVYLKLESRQTISSITMMKSRLDGKKKERTRAMDFCVRGVSSAKLLAYVKTLPIHYAYQIGNSDFVHMDVT